MNEHVDYNGKEISDCFSAGESDEHYSGWRSGKSHAQAEWTGLTGKEKKMGETIIEKIIRHNTGKAVKPGDIVTVNVDRVMIHDIFTPLWQKNLKKWVTKLHDPDKVVLIYDHLVPASQQDDTRHFRTGDAFADKYGLTHVHRSDGILPSADDRGWLC